MIEDECQGQGLGSLLLQALEQEASDRQIKVIVLDARDVAIKFYERNGYTAQESFIHSIGIASTKMGKVLSD